MDATSLNHPVSTTRSRGWGLHIAAGRMLYWAATAATWWIFSEWTWVNRAGQLYPIVLFRFFFCAKNDLGGDDPDPRFFWSLNWFLLMVTQLNPRLTGWMWQVSSSFIFSAPYIMINPGHPADDVFGLCILFSRIWSIQTFAGTHVQWHLNQLNILE